MPPEPRTDGWDAGDHEPIRPLSMARKPVPFEVRLESDDEIIALQSALSEYWEIQTDVHVGERVLRRGWTVTLPNKKRLQHTKSVWDLQAAGRADHQCEHLYSVSLTKTTCWIKSRKLLANPTDPSRPDHNPIQPRPDPTLLMRSRASPRSRPGRCSLSVTAPCHVCHFAWPRIV